MPLQNRVTPYGEIVAVSERGLLMGNRGVLHNDARQIVRPYQVQRWIACRTEFRGRHRQVMRPGSYTELFFLDEATAFAAGHRPCAECRHEDYLRFKSAWASSSTGALVGPRAEQMDAVLHAQRLMTDEGAHRPSRKRTYEDEIATLPDGTMLDIDGVAWLLWRGALHQWSPAGYTFSRPEPRGGRVPIVTPQALVEVLRAGYELMVHPSVGGR